MELAKVCRYNIGYIIMCRPKPVADYYVSKSYKWVLGIIFLNSAVIRYFNLFIVPMRRNTTLTCTILRFDSIGHIKFT